MHKILYSLLFLLLVMATYSCKKEQVEANYKIIPLPNKITVKEGSPFVLNSSTKIVYSPEDENLERVAIFLSQYIKEATGTNLKVIPLGNNEAENAIVLQTKLENENEEAYKLSIDKNTITIDGSTAKGAFYGVQTLYKSIIIDSRDKDVVFSSVLIEDEPRFRYRGMMLDVARHFSSVEFVKAFIDQLALHNINTFHWHLTDDQGWRIEIKKHPKLTELGSARKGTQILPFSNLKNEEPYGEGLFYTQEQIKDVIAYASERFITIIPEIDLPGHMLGALKAYPELGCTGGPYEVSPLWGVFDDVLCVGNDHSIELLKDIFAEVIDLFPAKYIHIGGDECPKNKWEVCPKCQAKIKALGLKTDKNHTKEEYLQSYCMTAIEGFINSKGKSIIGWDEILEGGIAPNATIMSWRGVEGGIKAAQQGHDVIMTPFEYVYFDYFDTQDVDAPEKQTSVGRYLPIEKVYSFNPIFDELTAEQANHILGVQANIWCEYLPTEANREYTFLPRLDAISEVQWTLAENKDYASFEKRLERMLTYYDVSKLNYSKSIYDIKYTSKANVDANNISIELASYLDMPIYYTMDGSEPTSSSMRYTEPISIDYTSTLKAVAIGEKHASHVIERDFVFSKSTNRSITTIPHSDHARALTDGMMGNKLGYLDGSWIGFGGAQPIVITVNLGGEQDISQVSASAYIRPYSGLLGATSIAVYASMDGKSYVKVGHKKYDVVDAFHPYGALEYRFEFSTTNAQYVKLEIEKTNKYDTWYRFQDRVPSLYLDEIVIN